jgi:hypothetical protein
MSWWPSRVGVAVSEDSSNRYLRKTGRLSKLMRRRTLSARFFFDDNSSLLPSPERRQAGPDPVSYCTPPARCTMHRSP